jgi:UDP-2-acetamido-2-deoxy-ribo-hexuluronate aminotransferase
MQFIDLKRQQAAIRADLEARLAAVLDHGQYIMGPEVAELERTLARFVGVGHCVSVASGTEGLLVALMALGIGPGDEVITTPFTFVATAETIVLAGATPVFADVDPASGNVLPSAIERLVTPATRAIMPVSLYGQPADMDEINAVAARHGGIAVIEDAAQSFGALYRGRRSGALSTIGVTSFFPSKPLGCYGDGGALFTDDEAIAQAAREIRVHGQSARYHHTRIGLGGRMDTLQCAVLLAKWPRFGWEVEERSRIGAAYARLIHERVPGARALHPEEAGGPLAGLRTLACAPDRTSVYAQYTVLAPERDALAARLKERGVPTAVHYPAPVNRQPAYAGLRPHDATPMADWLAQHVLSLPMGPDLAADEQDAVVAALADAAAGARS